MPELKKLRSSHVIRIVTQADPRAFALFLGAGASKSSGIPLAAEMIKEWRTMLFADTAPEGAVFEEWCEKQEWFKSDHEYSTLFENVFPKPRDRQKYVEPKIEGAFPSWCYLYLANMVKNGKFNVIFTTNFDDLINEALTIYLSYNPIVCAADSEVVSISLLSERAKVIKLHGDYLFEDIKNSKAELNRLTGNMERKFKEFCQQCGMVVIGYAGNDESIMSCFESLMEIPTAFPNGVYWGLIPGESPAKRVSQLAKRYPDRFHLFQFETFDTFMSGLHSELKPKLELPDAVLQPYEELKKSFGRLTEVQMDQVKDPAMKEHIKKLKLELNRPWAKADQADFDLLEAQMAVGRAQKKDEAIKASEELLKLAPNNKAVRRSLVDLYASSGKLKEALREVDWLLDAEPDSSEFHALRATVLEQRGLLAEALTETEKAVNLDPQNAGYHFRLGNGLARMGRLDEAAHEFIRAIELAPNTLSYRLQAATFYCMLGRPAVVLPHLEAAVQIEPDSAEAHGWLGQIYMLLGRMVDAQRETEAALKLSPRDVRLVTNAGMIYMYLNRPDVAEGYLKQATQLNPNIPQPFHLLCFLYWRQYRDQEFQAAFQRLQQIAFPVAQQLNMYLQQAHVQFQGNREMAASALQQQGTTWGQQQPTQAPPPQPWAQPQPRPSTNQGVNDWFRSVFGKPSS